MITNKIKPYVVGAAGVIAAASTFVVARICGAVSQFAAATNSAQTINTDLGADSLLIAGGAVVVSGGLLLLVLAWKRGRHAVVRNTKGI